MTKHAANSKVRAGKREARQIMVKGSSGISGRMAGIAGTALINVSLHSLMAGIHIRLIMGMTGYTGEYTKVIRVSVAVAAGLPGTIMFTGINREVLSIVIKSCRLPCCLCMTGLAVGAETGGLMIGIRCTIIISSVASITLIRCIVIITIMACSAGYCSVSSY